MVRFLVLYEQPSDIEAFEQHYREVHVPLTQALPGLCSYRLSRDVEAIRGGEAYHLVAELEAT